MAELSLHGWSPDHERLAAALAERITGHLGGGPVLGRTPAPAEVAALAAITPAGLGVDGALALVDGALLPNNVALDHPNFLGYIPAAPATTAALFDGVVGAWSFSAESWQEAGGAVAAEESVLTWLADLAGLPAGAGGCFVNGGTIANLAGLAVARDQWRARRGSRARMAVAVTGSAHSSIGLAAHLLDLELVAIDGDEAGRLTAAALRATLAAGDATAARIGAVAASAGATNTGAIDDLAGLADVAAEHGLWLHVDAAYGGGALLLPERRAAFTGLERADSLVIDPHKWLFSPLDCAAILYRDRELGAATHRQTAAYLDAFGTAAVNPSAYAPHLTRRARGLPLWFGLVVHGTDAYARAVRAGIDAAGRVAERIERLGPPLRLVMPPPLSVVLFERDGWNRTDWDRWAASALADGLAFVAPTRWRGRDVGRLVFLHPEPDLAAVDELVRRVHEGG